MIFFDHTYGRDLNHRFLKKLQKFGFSLMPDVVEHPGKLFCRFIMFSSATPKTFSYLEFVHIGRGGESRSVPGLSFGYSRNLEGYYKKLKRGKSPYGFEFRHRNYAWKKDSRSRLPGWNFLDFKHLGFRGFYPWITEYEPHPGKKRHNKPRKTHANGVTKIVAFEMELDKKGERFLSFVTGKKIRQQKIQLKDGTTFYYFSGRRNRIKTVVLKCKNLGKIEKKYKFDAEIKVGSQRALLIRNPDPKMWNLAVI
jgi:hypothetical protein